MSGLPSSRPDLRRAHDFDDGDALPPGDLTGGIEQRLDDGAGDLDRQIDFRRSPQGAADVSVIFKGRVSAPVADAIRAAFGDWDAVESARLSKNRLTLRFTSDTLARVDAGLFASAHDPLQLYGTASGVRVLVDFLDPNANKALHVGHLRNIALGHNLARLWYARGATVIRQSVVCDIGRNIAEALAGLTAAGAEDMLAQDGALDRVLGQLYGDVAQATVANSDGLGESHAADAPIERELAVHGDEADHILSAWRAGDADVRALWRRVIDRVLSDQANTLARLGVGHDIVIRESDAVDPEAEHSALLAEELVSRGLAIRDPDGVVLLETGREDYARCPLTRSDGFATEHLRALWLWRRFARRDAGQTHLFHVMGEEWQTSTEIRIAALSALGHTDGFKTYRPLPHQLVRLDGSTMKSSTGHTLLIDDLLDTIEETLPAALADLPAADRRQAAATIALTPFMIEDTGVPLDVSLPDLLDPQRNPGFDLMYLALCEKWTRHAAAGASDDAVIPSSPTRRFALLQGERLRRVLIQSSERGDPIAPVRFLSRLVETRSAEDIDAGAEDVMRHLIRAGLRATGLLASENPTAAL